MCFKARTHKWLNCFDNFGDDLKHILTQNLNIRNLPAHHKVSELQ